MATLGELIVKIKGEVDKTFQASVTTAKNQLNDFSNYLEKHKATIAGITKASGIAFAGLTGVLALAVKEASNAEKVDARLAGALKNVVTNSKLAADQLSVLASKLSLASGYADEDLKEAMTELLNITGSYNVVLEQSALIADVARGANIDLHTAARLVGMAYQGNTGMLTRYGIVLRDGAKGQEALVALQEKFSGASAAYMSTAEGQMARFRNAISDLAETLGNVLLPHVTSVLQKINKWVEGLLAIDKEQMKFIVRVGMVATAVTGAATALGGLLLAFGNIRTVIALVTPAITGLFSLIAAHPFGALATAIGAAGIALSGWLTKVGEAKSREGDYNATLKGQLELRKKKVEAILAEGRARGSYQQSEIEAVTRLRHEITVLEQVIKKKESNTKTMQNQVKAKKAVKSATEEMIASYQKELKKTQELNAQVDVYTNAIVSGYNSMTAAVIENNRLTGEELKIGLKAILNSMLDYYMTQLSAQLALYISMLFNPLLTANAAGGIAATTAQMAVVQALKIGVAFLQEGGIVLSPQLAMIAEGGSPEAVIPLDNIQPMIREAVASVNASENNQVNVTIYAQSTTDINWDALVASKIKPALERNLKLQGRRL